MFVHNTNQNTFNFNDSCYARKVLPIDHMHMTSQKGAQLRWGSNKTLPRASSPSMQPGGGGGANPASHTAGLARPGPCTERLSANAHCQHNTCALRDTRLASLLWRCDPLWRQCIRSIQGQQRHKLAIVWKHASYAQSRGRRIPVSFVNCISD